MRYCVWLAMLAACGTNNGPANSGPPDDGGFDAGQSFSDGGPLGSACTSLFVCGGNPICSDELQCSVEVICAAGLCAEAGGPANGEAITVGFAGTAASPLPTYLQIYLLAPQMVGSGTLDCPTLLAGLDAGTLNPNNATQVNPLIASYDQNVGITSASMALNFELNSAATGTGRVLYMEGYLDIGEPDGGAELLARACTSFDDTDAGLGTASATLQSLW